MKRVLTIWAILGAAYVALETVFRGYSHPSMLIVGGLCGVLVGTINQRPGFFRAPVIVQAVIGALIVLAVEFVSGCILNLWLGWGFGITATSRGMCWGRFARRSAFCGFSLCPLRFGRRTQHGGPFGTMSALCTVGQKARRKWPRIH